MEQLSSGWDRPLTAAAQIGEERVQADALGPFPVEDWQNHQGIFT